MTMFEVRNHELPLLLNVDETAQILRSTRGAVYVMAARGQLPGVTRIGRRLLVRSDDLLDWLDQKRAPSLQE
jgi:excisionase family DNA binding protein